MIRNTPWTRIPPKRRRQILIGVGAAAALAAYFVIANNLSSIDVEGVLQDVSRSIGAFTYLLVGVFAFLETGAFVGLVVPGETIVILGGAVAGQGETSLILTIGIVWAAAFAGDTASFFIGRKLGRGFVLRHGPRFRITPERFARVEAYFEDHGGKTILIGRFIGIVRALAPFIAGSSGMRYAAMCPYSILGTGLWAAFFTVLGYIASRNLNEVVEAAERGTLVFAVVVGVIVAIIVAIRFLRVAENRAGTVEFMERRPVLRGLVAFGRRLRPQAQFVWERLTPGGLGLEFTTLIAALAVALYVLIAYTVIVSGDPGPTPGDETASDIVRGIEAGWLTEVNRVLSALGSAAVVVPIALVVAVILGWQRAWVEVSVLAIAIAIILIVVPEMKDAIDRPRPPDAIVSAEGSAFPSGHAAQSILYAWLALTVVIRMRPGITGGTAIIVSGIALAGLIGLSRLYLRVHYLSDVTSGWGLGVSAFALCAALALLVLRLRQNAARDAAPGGDPA